MKKIIAIFAIAAIFTACNNEADTGMTPEDSARIADSIKNAEEDAMKMQQDTTSKILEDNSSRMMQDTAK